MSERRPKYLEKHKRNIGFGPTPNIPKTPNEILVKSGKPELNNELITVSVTLSAGFPKIIRKRDPCT